MTYHLGFNMSNITGATYRLGTAYLSEVPEFTTIFFSGFVFSILVICVVFCTTLFMLFVLFHLTILLSVLRFTASAYPFDIFKLFLIVQYSVVPSCVKVDCNLN